MFKFFGGQSTNNEDVNLDSYLVLDRRQASWFIGGIILAGALLFVAGYMVGKRNAMREFSQKIVDDSFEDRAQYALHSMYGSTGASLEKADTEADEDALEALARETSEAAGSSDTDEAVPVAVPKKYYAQLVGFGTLPA